MMNYAKFTLAAWGLAAATVLVAAEYYLAPAGDDAAAGTRLAPWRTLAKANEALQPGDTAVLLSGRYEGAIAPVRSGEPGKMITYRGDASGRALVFGVKDAALELNRRDYIAIRDLHFNAAPKVHLARIRNCRFLELRDSTFSDARDLWAPVLIDGAEFCRFDNLVVDGCLKSPERLDSTGGFTGANLVDVHRSRRNVFSRLRTSRGGHTPFVIWNTCEFNVVRDCVFDSRWARNFEFFNAESTLIERCAVVNAYHGSSSADTGAKLFIRNSIFRRNLIVRNADTPLVAGSYSYPGFPPFGIQNSRFYGNTFAANGGAGWAFGEFPKGDAVVVNNVFKNNLWSGNNPGGDPVAIQFNRSVRPEENRFAGNLFWGRKAGDPVIRVVWPPQHLTLREAEKAFPAMFQNNMECDPAFVDAAADRYDLRPGSPAIDRGEHLTVTRSAGRGKVVAVADARYFYDGFGIPGEKGDEIRIGTQAARVMARDLAANTLTLDRELRWQAGEPVNLPFSGIAPDPGAYEFGLATGPAAPENLVRPQPQDYSCDFEPEHLKDWAAWWYFQRQGPSTAALELTAPARRGKGSMRIFYAYRDAQNADRMHLTAPASGTPARPSNLAAFVSPANWRIAAAPRVRFAYRIPAGVPVGVTVRLFPKNGRPDRLYLGGSPAFAPGQSPNLQSCRLIDDGQWHDIEIDLGAVSGAYSDVEYLCEFGFRTEGNGKPGDAFWIDDFRIIPAKQ